MIPDLFNKHMPHTYTNTHPQIHINTHTHNLVMKKQHICCTTVTSLNAFNHILQLHRNKIMKRGTETYVHSCFSINTKLEMMNISQFAQS